MELKSPADKFGYHAMLEGSSASIDSTKPGYYSRVTNTNPVLDRLLGDNGAEIGAP
jgi:hypothetical protein